MCTSKYAHTHRPIRPYGDQNQPSSRDLPPKQEPIVAGETVNDETATIAAEAMSPAEVSAGAAGLLAGSLDATTEHR